MLRGINRTEVLHDKRRVEENHTTNFREGQDPAIDHGALGRQEKSNEMSPKYRSRLVARQMKHMDHSGQSSFAPAPPLEALKTLLGLATTQIKSDSPVRDPTSAARTKISPIDVRSACLNGTIDPRDPPTLVGLLPGDLDCGSMRSRLPRNMYGTKGAAGGWQEGYSTALVRHGFKRGVACPNLSHHPVK